MDPTQEVVRLVHQGVSFSDVEDHIEGMKLDHDEKSALWLLAWVEVSRRESAWPAARGSRSSRPAHAVRLRAVFVPQD